MCAGRLATRQGKGKAHREPGKARMQAIQTLGTALQRDRSQRTAPQRGDVPDDEEGRAQGKTRV